MPNEVAQDAGSMAQYILNQVANHGRFGLSEAQIAEFKRSVEPEFRSQVERWTLLYIGWLLYHSASRCFGESFGAGIIPAIDRFTKTPDEKRAAADIDVWFPRLDAAARKPQMVHGIAAPRVMWAVFEFVLEDPVSPYFNLGDTPVVKFARLYGVIDRAAITAGPTLRGIVGPETSLDELAYLAEVTSAVNPAPKKAGLNMPTLFITFFAMLFVTIKAGGNPFASLIVAGIAALAMSFIVSTLVPAQHAPNVTCPYCSSPIPTAVKPSASSPRQQTTQCPNCGHDLPQLSEL
jgi:hypothetical protein